MKPWRGSLALRDTWQSGDYLSSPTQDAEAGGSENQGHLQLCLLCEFKASPEKFFFFFFFCISLLFVTLPGKGGGEITVERANSNYCL